MTEYHQCAHLEATIKVMPRGTLHELWCNKLKERPVGRTCKDCIYEVGNK